MTPTTAPTGSADRLVGLVRMTRPDHLLLVAVVFAWGVAMAWADGAAWDGHRVVATLGLVLVVAVGIHLANEVADRDTDALTRRTRFSGGSGATVDLDLDDRAMGRVLVVAAVAAAGVGLVLAAGGLVSSVAAALVAVAAVGGWQYSSPPLALARRGWGEVDNALLGGMVLPLTGAASLGRPDAAMLLAVVPLTLLVFANLLATQWPDRWADAAVGKHTLATRWRPGTVRRAHRLAVGAAFVVLVALPPTVLPPSVVWGSVASAPLAGWAVATVTTDDRPLPTVATMVVFVVGGLAGWVVVLARG